VYNNLVTKILLKKSKIQLDSESTMR